MTLAIEQRSIVTVSGSNWQFHVQNDTSDLDLMDTKNIPEGSQTAPKDSLRVALHEFIHSLNQDQAAEAMRDFMRIVLEADAQQNEQELVPVFTSILQKYGEYALGCIEHQVWNSGAEGWVVAEILSLLGRINPQLLYKQRAKLLHDTLNSLSPAVRDGALSGLASLKDRQSVLHLRLAASRESVPDLKRDMSKLANYLQGL